MRMCAVQCFCLSKSALQQYIEVTRMCAISLTESIYCVVMLVGWLCCVVLCHCTCALRAYDHCSHTHWQQLALKAGDGGSSVWRMQMMVQYRRQRTQEAETAVPKQTEPPPYPCRSNNNNNLLYFHIDTSKVLLKFMFTNQTIY